MPPLPQTQKWQCFCIGNYTLYSPPSTICQFSWETRQLYSCKQLLLSVTAVLWWTTLPAYSVCRLYTWPPRLWKENVLQPRRWEGCLWFSIKLCLCMYIQICTLNNYCVCTVCTGRARNFRHFFGSGPCTVRRIKKGFKIRTKIFFKPILLKGYLQALFQSLS